MFTQFNNSVIFANMLLKVVVVEGTMPVSHSGMLGYLPCLELIVMLTKHSKLIGTWTSTCKKTWT
jgi:hypothetical protein